MFGVGLPEFAVIAFIAVLVFGPDKLPDLARQAGQMVRKVTQMANTARDELRAELGPEYADLELRDLDPRAIVRRHITEAMDDDDDDEPVRATRRGSVRSRTARSRRTTPTRPERYAAHRLCTAARRRGHQHAPGRPRRPSTSTKSAPTRRTPPS